MTYQKKLESLILMGSDLRILLSSSHITPGEVQSILRLKGIYAPSSDKRDTVPLLASTLLTPDEFTNLVEMSVSRESVPKHKVATVALASEDADWKKTLQTRLPAKLRVFEDTDGSYEISAMPSLQSKDERVFVNYTITRKDFSKDWLQRELTFDGSIEVSKKGGGLVLQIGSVHSSKETDKINGKLISLISATLHEDKVIDTVEVNRIAFSSFTNIERVKFFKSLSAGHGSVLATGDVDDVEIFLDPTKPDLPKDAEIDWMRDSVESLRIGGNKLNDLFLLQKEDFYDYFNIRTMIVDYPFTFGANEGKCKITFFFEKPSKPEMLSDSEFTISHARPRFENAAPNETARREVDSAIRLATREMVDSQFAKVKCL